MPEPWPFHAALEDDLRCGASQAARPGPGDCLASLITHPHMGPEGKLAAIPGSRDIVQSPQALLSPFVR